MQGTASNLLHENPQITSMGDLLTSTQRTVGTQQGHKAVEWHSGKVHHDCFCSRSHWTRLPIAVGCSKSCASYCASTLFCRGWLSQLPRICLFFIHYNESLLWNVWNSLIIKTVFFVSSLSSTTPFFAERAFWSWTRKSDMHCCQMFR